MAGASRRLSNFSADARRRKRPARHKRGVIVRGLKMLAEATQKKGKIQHMPDLSLEHGKFMAQDWDRRADDSPLYWIAMMENDKEFVASGEANLREHILNDITL